MYLIFKTRTESNRNQRVRRQPIPQLLLTQVWPRPIPTILFKNKRSAKARIFGSHGPNAHLEMKRLNLFVITRSCNPFENN